MGSLETLSALLIGPAGAVGLRAGPLVLTGWAVAGGALQQCRDEAERPSEGFFFALQL